VRIWIDFANSPHPLLFAPIVRRLEELGDEVLLTTRDHAQTLELARERWPQVEVVGGRSPAGRVAKARALYARIAALHRWARRTRPDVALSHNSYAQIVAARTAGVPVVTAMDYEHQPANHLAFRLAHRILLPVVVPLDAVRSKGAAPHKVVRYNGLKEELYVGDFDFDADTASLLGVERDGRARVVVRGPPLGAIYHRFENPLFADILRRVGQTDAQLVVLVRQPEERRALERSAPRNAVIPEVAVDARSLIYMSDLVIGAGGTMTREAALLAIPSVSIYAGPPAAVDRYLEQEGRLRRLESAEELGPICKRSAQPRSLEEVRSAGRRLTDEFVAVTRDRG